MKQEGKCRLPDMSKQDKDSINDSRSVGELLKGNWYSVNKSGVKGRDFWNTKWEVEDCKQLCIDDKECTGFHTTQVNECYFQT